MVFRVMNQQNDGTTIWNRNQQSTSLLRDYFELEVEQA